jgi:hypothetical protein
MKKIEVFLSETYLAKSPLLRSNCFILPVMASALIYLVIVAMWVAYFIPRWRKRHDDATGRSADRFKNAIKMVSGDFSQNPPIPSREERAIHLRRRRLAFLGVLLTFVIATAVVTTTKFSSLLELIPASAFMIYVVSVRRQHISVQLRNRRLRVLEQISHAPVVIEQRENVMAREINHVDYVQDLHTEMHFNFDGSLNTQSSSEQWVPLSERESHNGIVLLPRGSSILTEKNPAPLSHNDSWSPVEVPLPTYVTAPKAVTPRRVIDLTVPGEWSATHEQDKAFDAFIAEQSLLPERADGFATDLENEGVINPSHRASGQ